MTNSIKSAFLIGIQDLPNNNMKIRNDICPLSEIYSDMCSKWTRLLDNN